MTQREAVRSLAREIRRACAAHADPKQAARYARYFKEGYDAYGVHWDEPAWQGLLNEWLEKNRKLKLRGFLRLGEELVSSGKYEETSVAITLVARLREEYTREAFGGLARWFRCGIGNWAHTDVLCGEVLSHFVVNGIVRLEELGEWRDSAFKYQRRAVPVMLLPVLKQASDHRPMLELIRPLMTDPERVVQQGVGWFLREAWKLKPKPVEALLMEYRDRSPRLIFQYATEKMTAAGKQRFRRPAGKAPCGA